MLLGSKLVGCWLAPGGDGGTAARRGEGIGTQEDQGVVVDQSSSSSSRRRKWRVR